MIGIQGWSGSQLVKAIATPPSATADRARSRRLRVRRQARLLRQQRAEMGRSCPTARTPTTSPTRRAGMPAMSDGTSRRTALTAPRTIWTDSQGNAISPSAYLERAVAGVSRGSWTVFDAPEAKAEVYGVFDARETSRADYGLSGRAMALTLASDSGTALLGQAVDERFRSAAPRPIWRARSSRSPICRSTRRSPPAIRRSSSTAWCSASRSASRSRSPANAATCRASMPPRSRCSPTSSMRTGAPRWCCKSRPAVFLRRAAA